MSASSSKSAFVVHNGVDFNRPDKWPEGVVKYLSDRGYPRELIVAHSREDGIVCLDAEDAIINGLYKVAGLPRDTSYVLLYLNADLHGNADGYAVGVAFSNAGVALGKIAPESKDMPSRPFFPLGFKPSELTYRTESPLKAIVLRRRSGGKCNAWATHGAGAVTDSKHRAGFLHLAIEQLLLKFPNPEIIDVPDSDYGGGIPRNGNSDVISGTKKLMTMAKQVNPNFQGKVAHLQPLFSKEKQKTDKADLNDYIARFGFDYFYEAFLLPAHPWRPTSQGPVPELRFQSAADLLSAPDPEYTVAGLIPKGSLIALFSVWGVGKTFLMIHLSRCVAEGAPWLGKEVKQGAAFYFLLEGGMKKRIQAYEKRYRISFADLPFHVHNDRVDLLNEDFVERVIDEVRSHDNPGIIVIDTLARAIPGADENSAKDMGAMVAAVDRIRLETGCSVILVAHPGKDPNKGLRGSSAVPGAVDGELTIWRSNPDLTAPLHDQPIGIRTVKPPRDDEPWAGSFTYERVELDNGQSSLVVVEVPGQAVPAIPTANQARRGADKAPTDKDRVMEALRALAGAEGSCTEDQVLDAVMAYYEKVAGFNKDSREAAKRHRTKRSDVKNKALKALVTNGSVLRHDDGTYSVG